MKRLALLLCIPIVLWGIGKFSGAIDPSGDATIALETDRPAPLRTAVMARVTSLGGTRVAETSTFGDDARSELRFRVPERRLEETLVALGDLGARVTEQHIDVESDPPTDLSDELVRMQQCLDDATDRPGAAALDRCRDQLDSITTHVSESATATLNVTIASTTATSVWDVVGVAIAAILILTGVAIAIRMRRRETAEEVLAVDAMEADDPERAVADSPRR